MQKENQEANGLPFVILGIVMTVVSILIIYLIFIADILPGACFFLLFITVPLIVNGFAYLITYLFIKNKGNNHTVLALICLIMAIVSAIIGVVLFVNDHSFMMRGAEAQFFWFFISVPSFVVAIIHFIISFIHMSRKLKSLEE